MGKKFGYASVAGFGVAAVAAFLAYGRYDELAVRQVRASKIAAQTRTQKDATRTRMEQLVAETAARTAAQTARRVAIQTAQPSDIEARN